MITGRKIYSCLIYGFILLTFSSCILIKPVKLTHVSNFHFTNNITQPEFQFDIGILNPNGFGVNLTKMELDVTAGGPSLAKVSVREKTKLTPKESVLIPVVLRPSIKDMTTIFKNGLTDFFSDQQSKHVMIKGEFVIRKFIFTRKFRFTEKMNF
jgi:hypothetical protein